MMTTFQNSQCGCWERAIMGERYVVKKFGDYVNWVILDCENDRYVRRSIDSTLSCLATEVWRFSHFESAEYQAGILNSQEDKDG
jgi:hypothetical protein